MNDRDCKTCARSSLNDYGGNGCTSWSCDYINRREAIEAWIEKYRPDGKHQPAGGDRGMDRKVQAGRKASTGGRRVVWQMTWSEYGEDYFKPLGYHDSIKGLTDWVCPICSNCVGIYSDGSVHDEGWLMKRETCKNGHSINWEGID